MNLSIPALVYISETEFYKRFTLLPGSRYGVAAVDGDDFMPNREFGEDNCGNETNPSVKGDIKRDGNAVTSADKDFLSDIVGRYIVTIGGKSYDTVCVMDIEI